MKSTILKKVLYLFSVFLMTFFIASCKARGSYVENPYFTDTSRDDFSTFYDTFDLYLDELHDYYDETYLDVLFYRHFYYWSIDGFTPILDQPYYTKAEIAVNDHLIDERSLFLRSSMKRVLDNDRLVFADMDDLDRCKENTICGEDDTDNYLQFSIHEQQLYFTYSVRFSYSVYKYMFYISKDSNQKIHLEFLQVITDYSDYDVEHVHYVLYDEDVKELNMSFDGWDKNISYYDIVTKEKIESSFGLWWNQSSITYYDPELETEFECEIDDNGVIGDTSLLQFEQNHIKLSVDDTLESVSLRLNQIEGWNRIKLSNYSNPQPVTLYLDDVAVDDALIAEYDEITGNVMLKLESNFGDLIPEDLISLERYGLDSGYDYVTINALFDDFKASVPDLLERFDLNHTSEELIQIFKDTTGVDFYYNYQ